jgi:hypothetical protein
LLAGGLTSGDYGTNDTMEETLATVYTDILNGDFSPAVGSPIRTATGDPDAAADLAAMQLLFPGFERRSRYPTPQGHRDTASQVAARPVQHHFG